jgi:hypothetical protein
VTASAKPFSERGCYAIHSSEGPEIGCGIAINLKTEQALFRFLTVDAHRHEEIFQGYSILVLGIRVGLAITLGNLLTDTIVT